MGKVKILKASAGSGKTYRLAYEYIRSVIDSPQLYRHILAVTFTNKATEEMKQRIVGELNALANGSPSGYMGDLERDLGLDGQTIRRRAADARTKILHDYSRFTVLTIDKFFQRIIRSFIKELGIDLNFNLELQTDSILDSATDRLIDRIAVDRALRDWVLHFVEEKIDTDGRWDIRGEISQLGRELFGERYRAVSGEKASREELSRIVSAAVARSRRIENEMKKISRWAEALAVIDSAGLAAENFAYGRGGCVGYFVKTADGTIAPYGKRVLDALESEEKWVTARSSRKEAARSVVPTLRRLLAKLCSIYDDNIRFLNTARLLSANYRSFALLDDLSEKVAEICTEQNLVPISETNAILGKLMGDNDAPFIYEKVGNTFSRFMIDEFQDIDALQYELMEVLCGYHGNLFIVGDPDQTIYTWRGADMRFLLDFDKAFPDTRTIMMLENYRSTPEVIAVANSLIEKNRQRIPKDLCACRTQHGPTVWHHAKTSDDEAKWIAEGVRALHDGGIRYRDMAVLYRAHYASRPVEEAFLKAEIPHAVYSGVPFYGRKEIKDSLAYLRLVAYQDDLSFMRVANAPKRNLGQRRMAFLKDYAEAHACSLFQALEDEIFKRTKAKQLVALVRKFRGSFEGRPVSEVLAALINESGYEQALRTEGSQERLDNVAELKQSIYEFENSCGEEVTLPFPCGAAHQCRCAR